MSQCKYRVEQNGVFLGHYSGKDMDTIIQKAIDRYGIYYSIDKDQPFTLTRGQKVYTVYFNKQEA